MLKRYAIWDKESPIITPIGEYLSADEWKARYPVAKAPNITIVCAAGETNGGFFGTLGQMVAMYTNMGADFSAATTDEEKLEVIEAFEDAANDPGDLTESTPEERTAAALEALVMNNMETVNPDDPDAE